MSQTTKCPFCITPCENEYCSYTNSEKPSSKDKTKKEDKPTKQN